VSRDATSLRALPSVDQLVRAVLGRAELRGVSRPRVTTTVREVLDAERQRIRGDGVAAADPGTLATRVVEALAGGRAFSLRPVINATGVVLHTNLGRALLSPAAVDRLNRVAVAYSNLELDIETKERGSRYSHVEKLVQRLTGAEAALVVNNNAAAVLLALQTLAAGRDVIVSRGELIEIGGEFRIPDIMRRSGARLIEVGATNRTHLRDYADAIGPETALLLKVHTSNYRIVGFTSDVSSRALVELGRERGVRVMEDLGSGSLVDLRPWGFPYEPTVPEVVASGVDLVTFSGDKLLGGPQAGLIAGRADVVGKLTTNPLNRALRIDKLTVAALEATLAAYEAGNPRETVPTLRMLTEPLAVVAARARRALTALAPAVRKRLAAQVVKGLGQVGGGALPTVELPTAALAVGVDAADARALDVALRSAEPAVIGRIGGDRLLLDVRTVLRSEVPALARALTAAANGVAMTALPATVPGTASRS
jgi:L-seryl-tRNA(Ser) seleniumtransferase